MSKKNVKYNSLGKDPICEIEINGEKTIHKGEEAKKIFKYINRKD